MVSFGWTLRTSLDGEMVSPSVSQRSCCSEISSMSLSSSGHWYFAIFEALVEQQEARLIPEQALDAVLATAAEQEERRLMRIRWKRDTTKAASPSMDFRISVWPQAR